MTDEIEILKARLLASESTVAWLMLAVAKLEKQFDDIKDAEKLRVS